MRLPRVRFTVRRMMVAIFLVAADFAIVRWMWRGNIDIGIASVTLPMANLLILAALSAGKNNATRRFLAGFEIAGWLMVLAWGYLSRFHGEAFFRAVNATYPRSTSLNSTQLACLMLVVTIVYTAPQLLAAWLAGRLSAAFSRGDRLERSPFASDPLKPKRWIG
jgi:hypothetical protein